MKRCWEDDFEVETLRLSQRPERARFGFVSKSFLMVLASLMVLSRIISLSCFKFNNITPKKVDPLALLVFPWSIMVTGPPFISRSFGQTHTGHPKNVRGLFPNWAPSQGLNEAFGDVKFSMKIRHGILKWHEGFRISKPLTFIGSQGREVFRSMPCCFER